MANLIITVIAIALVAIASLMGAYYGGSAFLNNQSAANASTVLNQAQQIAGAWNAYLSDNLNTPPGNVSLLASGNYLAQIPTAPAAPGGVIAQTMSMVRADATINGVTGAHYFAVADVGAPGSETLTDQNFAACFRIIKTAIGPTAASAMTGVPGPQSMGSIVTNPVTGNGSFGCGLWSGDAGASGSWWPGSSQITNNHYTMAYLLE